VCMLQDRLKDEILTRLDSLPHSSGEAAALTVGVEHEFFLIRPGGAPCSHEDGQDFLACLGRMVNWYVRDRLSGPDLLWRVSREHPGGRYTAVKYDHHPHLFEVAFAYGGDLHALDELVRPVWADILAAASEVGLQVRSEPFLNISPEAPEVTSALEAFKELRHYRAELLKNRPVPVKVSGAVNYAAVIAATQVHVGGTGWWRRPELVPALYRLEPDFLALAPLDSNSGQNDLSTLLQRRWSGFFEVFRGYPLAGFPALNPWSLESWVAALLQSPLCGGPDDPWAGRTATEFPEVLAQGLDVFIEKVRDLQIIRPKLYGTLEFRADPARSGPAEILRLAALRLGVTAALLKQSGGNTSQKTLADARQRWFESVNAGACAAAGEQIAYLARAGLLERSKGEEVFLGKV